jgi:hypothetical protein
VIITHGYILMKPYGILYTRYAGGSNQGFRLFLVTKFPHPGAFQVAPQVKTLWHRTAKDSYGARITGGCFPRG